MIQLFDITKIKQMLLGDNIYIPIIATIVQGKNTTGSSPKMKSNSWPMLLPIKILKLLHPKQSNLT